MVKKISTIEMELALMQYFNFTQNLIVPNVSYGLGLHECDLLVVRKTRWAIEIEIKITKQDFLNDLKKMHGHIDKENRIKEFYFAMPDYIYEQVKELMPKNAGVIVCRQQGKNVRCKTAKKAKKIKNSRKLTENEYLKLLQLGCMRIYNLKKRIFELTK